jgi:hypothetical protein
MENLWTFLVAVTTNWAGYVTGSVVIALAWVYTAWKDKPMPRTFLLFLAAFFLFVAFYKAWNDEHKKVLAQVAYLQCAEHGDFDRDPFEIGKRLRMAITWSNLGTAPAQHPICFARFYAAPGNRPWWEWQQEVIKTFKSDFGDYLKKSGKTEWPSIFPASPTRFAVEGDVVTNEFIEDLKAGRQVLFLIGAVRFEDGAGMHEAHVFLHFSGVAGQSIQFEFCSDYGSQVDVQDS